MNSSIFLGRFSFERIAFGRFCLASLILVGAAGGAVQGRGILAGAELSGVSLGRGKYAYTLTLTNSPASTASIGLFWFAWAAGQADFLESEPTSIHTPSSWNATVEGGGGDDGYSIQFNTFTAPLAPGSSLTFTFDSPDSPRIMGGPAAFYPQYPTLMSQVYSAPDADGLQELFVALLVSPPAANPGKLTAQFSNPNLVLTWTAGTNVVLQKTSNFSTTNWTTVAGTLGVGTFTVTNVPGAPATFYRLATQ